MAALVGIIMGSKSDMPVMEECAVQLDALGVPYEIIVASAHRQPAKVHDGRRPQPTAACASSWAAAGKSAHLGALVAAYTPLPVITVAHEDDDLGGLDSLRFHGADAHRRAVACVVHQRRQERRDPGDTDSSHGHARVPGRDRGLQAGDGRGVGHSATAPSASAIASRAIGDYCQRTTKHSGDRLLPPAPEQILHAPSSHPVGVISRTVPVLAAMTPPASAIGEVLPGRYGDTRDSEATVGDAVSGHLIAVPVAIRSPRGGSRGRDRVPLRARSQWGHRQRKCFQERWPWLRRSRRGPRRFRGRVVSLFVR